MHEDFGAYQLLARLGAGGMGVVYRALWVPHGVHVALKRLHPAVEVEARRRFQREIDVLARLVHPNVVRLLDCGTVAGEPYYTMELVEGETLASRDRLGELMRTVSTDPELFHRMASGICAALEYLHGQGIVHRDLKPSNVFIDRQGVPRLADFGLAHDSDRTRITASGEVLGTPLYMAPEQWRGARADTRTDVYQAGLLLYELLTGTVPFANLQPIVAVLTARETRPIPPPSAINPLVAPGLDRVILRALSRSPADRHTSGRELGEALSGCRAGRLDKPIPSKPKVEQAPPPAAFQPLRALSVLGGVCLVGAAVLAPLAWVKSTSSGQEPGLPPGPDREPGGSELAISVQPEASAALVSFRTSGPARSWLELTGPDGPRRFEVSALGATLHTTWLSPLAPDRDYSFRVLLALPDGRQLLSREKVFRTSAR